MKRIKRVVQFLLLLIVIAIGLLYVTGNKHVLNGITKTYFKGKSKPDIDDMSYFELRKIPANGPNVWKKSFFYNRGNLTEKFLNYSDSLQTVSFLVIHKDSIVHEQYWEDYTAETRTNSFSMAKSLVGLAIGVAIKDGFIESVDQKASDFLPWLAEEKGGSLTIEHLLQMTSGIDFGESYVSPFGYQAKAYYGDDLRGITSEYRATQEPGTLWAYQGGNTVLLGMILEKATGQKVSTYFGNQIWSRIGCQFDAYWKLDHEKGMENFFSAFYSVPRDFARIGKLYMDDGSYYARNIVSKEYIEKSLRPVGVPDKDGKTIEDYGYHWWTGKYEGKELIYMRGIRGQYVLVLPEDDLIVVRMGHFRDEKDGENIPLDRDRWISEAYHILHQKNKQQ